MLSDFLTLEVYFGSPTSVQYFEDAVKRYGKAKINSAIECGDIVCRKINLGPDEGRLIAALSKQGRKKAHKELHAGNLAF